MTAAAWKPVVCAGDCDECPDCGEPVCPQCGVHYADCECPGPMQDGVEYRTIRGVLYGRIVDDE